MLLACGAQPKQDQNLSVDDRVEHDAFLAKYKAQVIQDYKDSIASELAEEESDIINNFDRTSKQSINGLEEIDQEWIDVLYQRELELRTALFDASEQLTLPEDFEKQVSTEDLKQRLEVLDSETPFHLEYNPVLERVVNAYLKNRSKYYPVLMTRAAYYFPMFEEQLDAYNIPLELKYLAIVESALKPRARSRVGATGLWQFMYGTGKQYGLNISSYVDEREDPVKATVAACEYLEDLYKMFGDWDLALAAYNSGPGNVSKAIRRSGGYTNYWNIRPYLPRETAGYVPAFYATMYIFNYADKHGLAPKEEQKVPYFVTDTLRVKASISFEQVSEQLDLSEETIKFLNPQYRLDVVPYVEGKAYSLRLPVSSINDFVDKEEEIYAFVAAEAAEREQPLPKYFEMNQRIRYKVRSGDYLGLIARRYGVTVSQIKKWNNLKSDNLKVGQRLTIYPRRLNFS